MGRWKPRRSSPRPESVRSEPSSESGETRLNDEELDVTPESGGSGEEPVRDDSPGSAEESSRVTASRATPPAAPRPTADNRLLQARELAVAGELSRAIDLYRDIVLDEPQNMALRNALGMLYDRRGDFALALEQFKAAKEIDDENIDILVNLANAQASLGRFDQAERELRRAVKLDPDRADAYMTLGIIYFRRGLYAQAEHELKRAVELDAQSATAYHYRGESLNQLNRVDEALTMLERAAQLQPGHARTYFVMGILLDKKGRPQEAAVMYRRAHEITAA